MKNLVIAANITIIFGPFVALSVAGLVDLWTHRKDPHA